MRDKLLVGFTLLLGAWIGFAVGNETDAEYPPPAHVQGDRGSSSGPEVSNWGDLRAFSLLLEEQGYDVQHTLIDEVESYKFYNYNPQGG